MYDLKTHDPEEVTIFNRVCGDFIWELAQMVTTVLELDGRRRHDVKLHTNGTLIPVRLGKVSLRHPETMIRRGRPDEITKEPKQIRKTSVRRSPSLPWSLGPYLYYFLSWRR
jgi:hypothetical protein